MCYRSSVPTPDGRGGLTSLGAPRYAQAWGPPFSGRPLGKVQYGGPLLWGPLGILWFRAPSQGGVGEGRGAKHNKNEIKPQQLPPFPPSEEGEFCN